jgi:hypothetical protein
MVIMLMLKPQQVHDEESANERNGQRRPRDDGGAPRVQEQKHNAVRPRTGFD